MKLLHTSDWHLGKKLYNHDFEEDHTKFFEWLLQTINNQNIDALIVSGDIFDTGYPSNSSLKLYYQVLTQLVKTCCKYVIIIGGNHDSVSTLNAPKEILNYLNIKVIGGIPQNIDELIIELTDNQGNIEAVVCAVPYLRDKDIRVSSALQTVKERNAEIRDGIKEYYAQVAEKIKKYKDTGIKVITTGHLYLSGAKYCDSERDIYVGNLTNIDSDIFDGNFDYIALGHLHKPQVVTNRGDIRFSGSPVALSFSEKEDSKVVIIIEALPNNHLIIKEIAIPQFRKMIRMTGEFEEIKRQLNSYKSECYYKDIAELNIETNTKNPFIVSEVDDFLSSNNLDIKIISYKINYIASDAVSTTENSNLANLSELKETEVFDKLLDFNEISNEEKENLNMSFVELLNWMNQEKDV